MAGRLIEAVVVVVVELCGHYVLIPIEISVCAGGSYKDVSHTKPI